MIDWLKVCWWAAVVAFCLYVWTLVLVEVIP